MKKKSILFGLILVLTLGLIGCNKENNAENETNINEQVEVSFHAKVLEVYEKSCLVEPLEGSNELNSSDKITVGNKDDIELKIGDIIEITYDGMIAETYPAQINNVHQIEVIESAVPIRMIMVEDKLYKDTGVVSTIEGRCGVLDGPIKTYINEYMTPVENGQANFEGSVGYQYGVKGNTIEIQIDGEWYIFETEDEVIYYNGKAYNKSELSQATLDWLELSEQDKLLSSYLPTEFIEIDNILGIELETVEVYPGGMVLRINQSGGKIEGELQTGSDFIIEEWTQETGWKQLDYIIDNAAWTAEAYMIPTENSLEMTIDWDWLYGPLGKGKYRLGKSIMDFKGTGDYENYLYYVEFEIE